jgi:hypothetical protein
MWKKKTTIVTYANMNMKKTWQGMFKTNVEYIKRNEESYFYLYPFGDLTQRSFQGGFNVCIK